MTTCAVDELRPTHTVYGLQVMCKTFDNYLVKHTHTFTCIGECQDFMRRVYARGTINLDHWVRLNDQELCESQQIMR